MITINDNSMPPVNFEFVSWLLAAGLSRSARQGVLWVPLHETRRCAAGPAARTGAGRHSALPAVPLSVEFPEPSIGVPELLNECRPVCSVTVLYPAQPKLNTRKHWTSHMELSATSTTVTGPVGECLQAGTEDAPVLDRPAPLRRFHDSGARYKYPDLLTYLLCTL